MNWKQWTEEVERQGVDDSTEMSFIIVDGGFHPEVTLHRPDPDDSNYKVADVIQGDHENDIADADLESASEFDESEFPTDEFPIFNRIFP